MKAFHALIFTALMALLMASCTQPEQTKPTKPQAKVELVDYTVSVKYLGSEPAGLGWYVYYWCENCTGRVTNKGDTTAYEVGVKADFGQAGIVSGLIAEVNLTPGEVGHFSVDGDTTTKVGQSMPDGPDSATATVDSVFWE